MVSEGEQDFMKCAKCEKCEKPLTKNHPTFHIESFLTTRVDIRKAKNVEMVGFPSAVFCSLPCMINRLSLYVSQTALKLAK